MKVARLGLPLLVCLIGCGSQVTPPGYTLQVLPATVSLTNGGSPQSLTVAVEPSGGFTSAVTVTLANLPNGVTATPASLTATPGQLAQFVLSATDAAVGTATPLSLTAISQGKTQSATAMLSISQALSNVTLSGSGFSFGYNVVGSTVTKSVVTVTNTGSADVTVNPTLTGDPSYSLVASGSCGATLAAGASCNVTISFAPQSASSTSLSATLNLGLGNVPAGTAQTITLTGTSGLLPPGFTMQATPTTLNLTNGGSAQGLTVSVQGVAGFTTPVTLSLSGLPTGVTAWPASLTVTPGQVGEFLVTASGAPVSTANITINGTSGSLTQSTTASLAIGQAISTAALSASSYDFSYNLIGSPQTKQVVTVINTGAAEITLNPSITGDPSYSLVGAQSCGASLAPGASCAETVTYAPKTASGTTPQTAVLNLGFGNVQAGTAQTVSLTGLSAVLPQGTVSTTPNPMVAQYSMTLPFAGSMTVNFGADTNYGKQTWTQSTTAGGTVSILVAGMPQNTTYHLQATVQLANGVTATDVDHTFSNGKSQVQPNLSVDTGAGLAVQSGVEQLTFINGSFGLAVTDLQGTVIWSYAVPNDPGGYSMEGAKLMDNGDFLVSIGEGSQYPLGGQATPQGTVIAVREIDLAGNIVRQITAATLTQELQAAGYNLTLQQFHHDVTPLPNGHWLVLANTFKSFTDLPGYPGTTNVLGDVVIDLDKNLQPVWVWNEFDHLDINHHPWNFPDWTHTNTILYSPSDHNLIVSMRHQNWVVKVDYQDGAGTGDVLWRLGEGGDFKLVGGTDPTDWQYAQHMPTLFSPNSSGIFSLGLMDNGDDRIFPAGVTCGQSGAPDCLYSTIPVFQIDEGAMTATETFHQILGSTLYSYFGGNTEQMANGDIEFDLAGTAGGSDIFEVTQTNPVQWVWHMHSSGANAYRGYRIPSLYPGVQW